MKYLAYMWIAWALMEGSVTYTGTGFHWRPIAEYSHLAPCITGTDAMKFHKAYICLPSGMYPDGYRLNLGS